MSGYVFHCTPCGFAHAGECADFKPICEKCPAGFCRCGKCASRGEIHHIECNRDWGHRGLCHDGHPDHGPWEDRYRAGYCAHEFWYRDEPKDDPLDLQVRTRCMQCHHLKIIGMMTFHYLAINGKMTDRP